MAKLSKAERDALPASAFVFPSSRRYPIHDKAHAHAALIDSRGTKDEATVRAAVRSRYGWDASNTTTGGVIDLTRYVRTEAGVRYFHKPIGSPIGGGGRSIAKVALKDPGYMVEGKHYDQFGKAVSAAKSLFDEPPAKKRVYAKQATAAAAKSSLSLPNVPRVKAKALAPAAPAADNKGEQAMIDSIQKSAGLSSEDVASAKAWWDSHRLKDDTDDDNLSSDLGLDPEYRERSIKELRKAIKDRHTSSDERVRLKTELGKRVQVARAVADESKGWQHRLSQRLEEKPEDADIAPEVGETLAEHPSLGALAHIWDRIRLAGYNVKKILTQGEFTEELPRVLARNIASVLIVGLLLHFGIMLPGIGGGG